MNRSAPLICARCGYSMQGLAPDAACPECGSLRREVDRHIAHRRSNLGYTYAFTACGILVYAVAAPFAVANVPTGPELYDINTWWLLLGWLAGAVFHLVALQCYNSALARPLSTGVKLWLVVLHVVWLLAAASVLLLYESAGQKGMVFPFGRERSTLDFGIKLSPAIPIATALMPSILACHFKRHAQPRLAKGMAVVAVGSFVTAGVVVMLFLLVWLDWSVGIDLYLSVSEANNARIATGLGLALLLSAAVSLAAVSLCIAAFLANLKAPRYMPRDIPAPHQSR